MVLTFPCMLLVGVCLSAVAMAEFVMSNLRSFETALDRELDLLSDRVSKAMQRVCGVPDAEKIFLEALNKFMEDSGSGST